MENPNPEEPESSNYYIIGMSVHGIEAIIDITEMSPEHIDRDNIARKLRGEDPIHDEFAQLHSSLSLRARFNGHRELQYWGISTSELSYDEINHIADVDEEHLIDLTKSRGVCLIK